MLMVHLYLLNFLDLGSEVFLPKNSFLNSFAVFSTPLSPKILYSLPSSPLKKLILSIKPKILTPVLSNIWIPLTSSKAKSWGVDTIMAPSTFTS